MRNGEQQADAHTSTPREERCLGVSCPHAQAGTPATSEAAPTHLPGGGRRRGSR